MTKNIEIIRVRSNEKCRETLCMKMKTKIILLIAAVITATVVTIVFKTDEIIEKMEEHFIEMYKNSRVKVINNYFLKSSQELKNRVYDITYWNEAFYNLEEENIAWLKDNMTKYIYEEPNFDIDLVFLQKNDGTYTELYGENIAIDDLLDTEAYKSASNKKILNKEYISINNQVYEIIAAPITTTYGEIKTNGILLLGRAIDKEFLAKLAQALTLDQVKKVRFVKNHIQSDPTQLNYIISNNDLMFIYYPVKDKNGDPLIWAKVLYDMSIFGNSKYLIFKEIAMTIVCYSFIAAVIGMIITNKNVNRIEKIISQVHLISQGNYKNRLEERGSVEMIELAKSVNMLSEEIERRIKEQEKSYLESVKALATSLEVKDAYTKGHSDRVAFYAFHLGEAIGYEQLDVLRNAAIVHDIGKISVPDAILNKSGKLTDEEYEVIKRHPDKGYKILDASQMFKDIKYIIKHHHERYDGKGYPDGLYGDDIPLGARILAVADVFDALTSDRAYREAMPLEEAMEIIKKGSGSHFDVDIVKTFEGIIYKLYKKNN